MPKLKTHKSASKRFRRTKGGKGKLMQTKIGKSHLRRKKKRRVRALFGAKIEVQSAGIKKRVRKLTPYLKK